MCHHCFGQPAALVGGGDHQPVDLAPGAAPLPVVLPPGRDCADILAGRGLYKKHAVRQAGTLPAKRLFEVLLFHSKKRFSILVQRNPALFVARPIKTESVASRQRAERQFVHPPTHHVYRSICQSVHAKTASTKRPACMTGTRRPSAQIPSTFIVAVPIIKSTWVSPKLAPSADSCSRESVLPSSTHSG